MRISMTRAWLMLMALAFSWNSCGVMTGQGDGEGRKGQPEPAGDQPEDAADAEGIEKETAAGAGSPGQGASGKESKLGSEVSEETAASWAALHACQKVEVADAGGEPVSVRAGAGFSPAKVGSVAEGMEFRVLDIAPLGDEVRHDQNRFRRSRLWYQIELEGSKVAWLTAVYTRCLQK